MDLTRYTIRRETVELARTFTIEGLLGYQPFVFSEDLQTGVGLEFERGHYVGLVYNPKIDGELLRKHPELDRMHVDPAELPAFRHANQRLRELYDCFVDEITAAIGDVNGSTFLDVGCNTGYFPLSFSLRGPERRSASIGRIFRRCFP